MKELTIEQKAKAYDEALNWMRDLYPNLGIAAKEKAESIFKELRESEDENIRKELIKFIKSRGGFKQEYIDWLKKQDKPVKINPSEFDTRLQALIGKFGSLPKEELIGILSFWMNVVQNDGTYKNEEKQGEQKSADKVKPKFHEGEWINGYYTNYKVLSVNNDGYVVEDVDGNKINILFENEKFHHLWTIQDAKDGDVLCSGQIILLFEKWECNDWNFVIAYAGIDISGKLQITDGHWLISNYAHPATKEQRDLLFQKMHEAGYEWDAEKKELKKISQRMISAEAKEAMYGNPAWSEEDERFLNVAINILNSSKVYTKSPDKYEDTISWLKSIKDRVQPQLKQEWSEEDEKKRKSLIKGLEDRLGFGWVSDPFSREEYIDWLKSLKERVQPQSNWKPSKEQIKALHDLNLTGNISYAGQGQVLIELYNDLKKLREE